MKRFKSLISLIIAFAFLISITACAEGAVGPTKTVQPSPVPSTVVQNSTTTEPTSTSSKFVKVNSIKLNKGALTLEVNKTFLLKVTYSPLNTTQKILALSTSDSLVAKIDASGKIIAISPGKVNITVSVNANKTVSATCVVTVVPAVIALKTINVNTKSVSLNAGKTYALATSYSPATTTQKGLKFSSNKTSVATVDSTGNIRAISTGTATITVASTINSLIKTTVLVTVKQAAAQTYKENGLSKVTKVNLSLAFFKAGAGDAWMRYAISTFQNKFPNVKIKITSDPSIDLAIGTKISAGNNADMFDLFSSARLVWEAYADNNKILRLDDIWNRAPYDRSGKALKNLVYPGAYKYQVYKRLGHVYSVPYCLDFTGLFFQKEYFVSKGWNQAPKTYAEFTALCDKIKAAGVYPITFYKNYLLGLIKPKEFELAAQNGNTKFDYNFRRYIGKQYTSPEAIEAYTKLYEMGQKGYFNPGSGTISHTVSQMQIIQHVSAMVISGSWIQNEMKNSVPKGFTWGFMAMPFVSSSTHKLYVQQASEDSQFIWKGKPTLNQLWSKEFVLWMHNLAIQDQMVKSGGLISIRTDYDDTSARRANIKGVVKQIVGLLNANKIVPIEIGAHERVLKDPQGLGDSAYTNLDEVRARIALGKVKPIPVLEKSETYFQQAVASGYK
jgi:N-acetylglucosamine transport system substrate-binding protein